MKKTTWIILLFTYSVMLFSQNGEKNFIDRPYIEVTGKAEMKIIPNEIYLSIVIDEKDNKGKSSLNDIEKKMYKTLEGIGVDSKNDLSIVDYASNFKNFLLKKDELVTKKKYRLLCHDANKAQAVFIGLDEIGISDISISKLSHSQIIEYKKDVKIEAIKAAKIKAEYLLSSIGQQIGNALYVHELNNTQARAYSPMVLSNTIVYKSMDTNNKKEVEIEFEKIHLEYEIMVRFEIK